MKEILNSIYSGIADSYRTSNDISLLTGTSGQILYLSYLYNATKQDRVKTTLTDMLQHTIEIINGQDVENINLTYGGGVTGFYWVINHIYKNKLLIEDSGMLKHILSKESDEVIAESLYLDFSQSRFDPLYGYIGKGLYFISKAENPFIRMNIEEILKALVRDRIIIDENRITWIDIRRKHEEPHPNNERVVIGDCGQAHGVTGIISFLCIVCERFKSKRLKEAAIALIKPAVNWLISQEIPSGLQRMFMFPMSVNLLEINKRLPVGGRLGWCYGDNIIAHTLYKAARVTGSDEYFKKANEITLNCCKIPYKKSGVLNQNKKKMFNPTICHGSAGIAEIYKQIYRYNQSPEVFKSINLWDGLTETYTSEYLKSGMLKSLIKDKSEAFDLLYGYAGIGLHMLSAQNSNHDWKSCLMLD